MPDYFDFRFWLAVAGAAAVKLLTSPWHSPTRAIVTVLAAVFSAWAFTDPVLRWWDLEPDTYRNAVAAILALTGEGGMRWIISATPEKLFDMWRGRK